MRALLAEIVEVDALALTALAAMVSGLVLTVAFSLAILGTAKAGDLRRSGRSVAAGFALALGLLALLASLAGVATALIVMIRD